MVGKINLVILLFKTLVGGPKIPKSSILSKPPLELSVLPKIMNVRELKTIRFTKLKHLEQAGMQLSLRTRRGNKMLRFWRDFGKIWGLSMTRSRGICLRWVGRSEQNQRGSRRSQRTRKVQIWSRYTRFWFSVILGGSRIFFQTNNHFVSFRIDQSVVP